MKFITLIFFFLLLSSTAYGKTKNNESQINKNLFEDKGILSFIKSFDNSNSAILDLVIKKDNDNLSSYKYIKGSQSFFEDADNISEVDDDKIINNSEDKFEKKPIKAEINNQNHFEKSNFCKKWILREFITCTKSAYPFSGTAVLK